MLQAFHQAQLHVRKLVAKAHHCLRHDLSREEGARPKGRLCLAFQRQILLRFGQLLVCHPSESVNEINE